jgi:hypothetical protein
VYDGLLIGEATGLAWQHADLSAGVMTIQQSVQRQQGKGMVCAEPKTWRSRQSVHLASGKVQILRHHQVRQKLAWHAAGRPWHDEVLVFCTRSRLPQEVAAQMDKLFAVSGTEVSGIELGDDPPAVMSQGSHIERSAEPEASHEAPPSTGSDVLPSNGPLLLLVRPQSVGSGRTKDTPRSLTCLQGFQGYRRRGTRLCKDFAKPRR